MTYPYIHHFLLLLSPGKLMLEAGNFLLLEDGYVLELE